MPVDYCKAGRLEEEPEKLRRCYPRGSGGFARVFQWLETCMTNRALREGGDDCPLGNDLSDEDRQTLLNARLVMIAHSMGTIVVNELLQLFPELPYESLVYMAGAAGVRETSRAVSPVLEANSGCTTFYGLMLHPMNEARELNKGGLLPSGSLLTYIDEFFEVPKTVPDRTFGQWVNLRVLRHLFFPEEVQKWMVLHVFDRQPGEQTLENGVRYRNPTTHGDFNDAAMRYWEPAVWKPEEVEFRDKPKPEFCENLFTENLLTGRLIHRERSAEDPLEVPVEEMHWGGGVQQQVDNGKTVAVTRNGRTIARIVPVND